MRLEPEDPSQVFRACRSSEIPLAVGSGQLGQGDERGGTNLFWPDEPFGAERAEDLLAAGDFDARNPRGLDERFDFVLRVVPESDLIP
jgi:hypothetical protein